MASCGVLATMERLGVGMENAVRARGVVGRAGQEPAQDTHALESVGRDWSLAGYKKKREKKR